MSSKPKKIKTIPKVIVPEGLEKWMIYLFEVVLIVKTEISGHRGIFREDKVIVERQHKYKGGDILKEIIPFFQTKNCRIKEIKIIKELGYGHPEF